MENADDREPTGGPAARTTGARIDLPRATRNMLAALLLDAIGAPTHGREAGSPADATRALTLLDVYTSVVSPPAYAVPMDALMRALPNAWASEAAHLAAALGRLRAAGIVDLRDGTAPAVRLIVLDPKLRAALPTLRRRIGAYDAARRALAALPPAPDALGRSLRDAAVLFNAGLFFEVHERLEEPWRAATGRTKTLLQGLLQIAVAFHHHAAGNERSAARLLAAGRTKIEAAHRPTTDPIRLAEFLDDVRHWEDDLATAAGDPLTSHTAGRHRPYLPIPGSMDTP